MPADHFNRRTFHSLALAGLSGTICPGLARGEEPPLRSASDNGVEPLPFVEGSFTIVALPDTQIYCESFPQHFYHQTQWIVDNRQKQNIQFVVHLGDITNRNVANQWEVARTAIQTLDGKVPYSLVPGNHDYGPGGSAVNRETALNEYFPISVVGKQPTFGGAMTEGQLENSYHVFSTRGQKFLVLALEWGPRDKVVEWANDIVSRHTDHHALLTTHAYMYFDETRYDWSKFENKQAWNPHSYGTAQLPGGTNDGQQLWDKLVSKHKNFLMTLNGHVLNDGLARLTSSLDSGGDVHQMLVNYQMQEEGGEGYLRLIEFLPDGKTVHVKCFSPSTGMYKTDPQNQFTLALNPALNA